MNLNEYQTLALDVAVYPHGTPKVDNGILYATLKLCGEAGEVAEKVGKALRGDYTLASKRDDILLELGDVLWYISAIAHELDATLAEVAALNLQKLYARKATGTLQGDGDHR